jgi:hypothetical protein
LPAVGGGDGVGRVLKVGGQVKKFRPGDLVKQKQLAINIFNRIVKKKFLFHNLVIKDKLFLS